MGQCVTGLASIYAVLDQVGAGGPETHRRAHGLSRKRTGSGSSCDSTREINASALVKARGDLPIVRMILALRGATSLTPGFARVIRPERGEDGYAASR